MGNSLKDALKSALMKVGNLFSSPKGNSAVQAKELPKKVSISTSKKIHSDGRTLATEEDVHFQSHMQKLGVKRTNIHDSIKHETPSIDTITEVTHDVLASTPTKIKKELLAEPIRKDIPKPIIVKKEPNLHKANTNKTSHKQPQQVVVPTAPYSIQKTGDVAAHAALTAITGLKNPLTPVNDGISEQIGGNENTDEREVVIGFDFGTSCAKVVIGDQALGKAFAVPFSKGMGLESFLLPSRVWLCGKNYTLTKKGKPQRNLKLRLIEDSCPKEYLADAVAFIALVIRHSRGWLFTQHKDIYARTQILWKLSLGLPAATYNQKHLVERFKKIAVAAWMVAGLPESVISKDKVETICQEVEANSIDVISGMTELKDFAFDVVPELSAQIYGFLTSSKFDSKARNIFMMVDVGAGTVDSSVFHATRSRGKFSFNFYANYVEFNGVANLHSARMKWLKTAFTENGLLSDLPSEIESIEMPTDRINGIPEKIEDYFEGINLSFHEPDVNPDTIFFSKRVKRQVLSDTLQGARKCVESDYEFEGMPLFLCGGGSRMKYYKKLEDDLLYHPNASWFRFKPRRLEVPTILSAPGVIPGDFDRLSVAFGLSFLDVGKCVRGVQITRPKPQSKDYSDSFVSKDMV